MALGAPGPEETQADVAGVRVAVAPEVADAVGHAEIDFIESPLQSGFTLANSEHSCGGMTH